MCVFKKLCHFKVYTINFELNTSVFDIHDSANTVWFFQNILYQQFDRRF